MKHSIAWILLFATLAGQAWASRARCVRKRLSERREPGRRARATPAHPPRPRPTPGPDTSTSPTSTRRRSREALAARLKDYGRETHMSLDDYITRRLESASEAEGDDADEVLVRRLAIAHLLQYLASGDAGRARGQRDGGAHARGPARAPREPLLVPLHPRAPRAREGPPLRFRRRRALALARRRRPARDSLRDARDALAHRRRRTRASPRRCRTSTRTSRAWS